MTAAHPLARRAGMLMISAMTQDIASKPPVTLSRADLYAKVWETPLNRLSAEFGVSGTALAKLCERSGVPYPPPGHWTKKVLGKPLVVTPLPNADNTMPAEITITPKPVLPRKKDVAPAVEKDAKEKAVKPAPAKVEAVQVPERLARPHAIIAGWLADHEQRKRSARGYWDPAMRRTMRPDSFSELQRREHRILDALFKALEKQGAKIRELSRSTFVAEVSDIPLEFQLREKLRQVRRRLTPEERTGWREKQE